MNLEVRDTTFANNSAELPLIIIETGGASFQSVTVIQSRGLQLFVFEDSTVVLEDFAMVNCAYNVSGISLSHSQANITRLFMTRNAGPSCVAVSQSDIVIDVMLATDNSGTSGAVLAVSGHSRANLTSCRFESACL